MRVDLDDVAPAIAGPDDDLIALDEALDRLEQIDKRKAEVVKLRFFCRADSATNGGHHGNLGLNCR